MIIRDKNISLIYKESKFEIIYKEHSFKMNHDMYIELFDDTKVYFKDAKTITVKEYNSGIGNGIQVHYSDFDKIEASFIVAARMESFSEDVIFELITVKDMEGIKEIHFPGNIQKEHDYTVLPFMQGVLLPSSLRHEQIKLPFHGQLCSAAAYISMFGQYDETCGYMMIHETPWDARYDVMPVENGYELHMLQLPSLGKMRYKRVLRYRFMEACDYNTMAKNYRAYQKERGYLKILREKEIALPAIKQLVGSQFVHTGICTFVQEDSSFYEKENPEKNNHLTRFDQRLKEMKEYKKAGIDKLYLHLDGWGVAYDNNHPDYLPINEAAGGPKGLKDLSDGMKEMNYLFGIHDQYRDYYHRCPSHSYDYAVQNVDGTYPEHSNWAGGRQNYLCASLAKDYVKRNFSVLNEEKIHLDAAYLDVFTCNEMDECANIMHQMTRKECADAREACFKYLIANNILPSSEECTDWSIRSLVFAHYGPYDFMMRKDETSIGIGIPLFNLVYHDCIILPWMMEKNNADYMLYALLNGGAPYLRRDAAYPNIDGAFENNNLTEKEMQERSLIVSKFHETIAYEEMIKHELLDSNGKIQRTTFANGTSVTIDLNTNTYEIKYKES